MHLQYSHDSDVSYVAYTPLYMSASCRIPLATEEEDNQAEPAVDMRMGQC